MMSCDQFSKRLIKLIGSESRASFARRCGFSDGALKNYMNGSMPSADKALRIAETCGVNIEWLITGEGDEQIAVDPVDTRLAEIEAQLNQASVPMSEDDLLKSSKWAEIRDELRLIAQDEDTDKAQRGRADLILRLAFSDKGAARRAEERQAEVGEHIRQSQKVYDIAVQAVGWEPSPIVRETMRHMIFAYRMELNDVIFLLNTFKCAVEGRG